MCIGSFFCLVGYVQRRCVYHVWGPRSPKDFVNTHGLRVPMFKKAVFYTVFGTSLLTRSISSRESRRLGFSEPRPEIGTMNVYTSIRKNKHEHMCLEVYTKAVGRNMKKIRKHYFKKIVVFGWRCISSRCPLRPGSPASLGPCWARLKVIVACETVVGLFWEAFWGILYCLVLGSP